MTCIERIFFLDARSHLHFLFDASHCLLYDMKVKLYLINWINKHHYVCQKYFHQKLVTFHAYNYDIAIWQHCFSSCHHTTSLNYHFFFFLIFVAPFLFLMVKMLFKVSCCEVSYYNKSNRRLQLVKFCRFLC